jgi:hypothetical protein
MQTGKCNDDGLTEQMQVISLTEQNWGSKIYLSVFSRWNSLKDVEKSIFV